MTRNDVNNFPYRHYLYVAIKAFINENDSKAIESEIKQKFQNSSSISIRNYSFNWYLSLRKIIISSSVISIGKNAFDGIKSLKIH